MQLPKSLTLLALSALVSCSHSTSFDRETWIDNPEITDNHNPRARMVQDVISSHLKPGMTRKSVLELLGQPYKDGIEERLPKNIPFPDSLSFTNPKNLKPENREKATAELNNFFRLYARPFMIMRYPVGWSTMDPNFLVIVFNNRGLVEEYWVEQS